MQCQTRIKTTCVLYALKRNRSCALYSNALRAASSCSSNSSVLRYAKWTMAEWVAFSLQEASADL